MELRTPSPYQHLLATLRFLAGLLLLSGLLNPAQASIAWAKNFGNSSTNSAYDVTTDSANNVYVTGIFNGATLTLGGTTLTRIGGTDAFVAKLDVYGNVVWAKNFGGAGTTMNGRSVGVDSSGNVFVAGNFSGGNITTPVMTLNGSSNYYIIKLDSTGNVLWNKNFGPGTAFDLNHSLYVDSSGNAFMVGSMTSNWVTPTLNLIGGTDAFVIKLDGSGNIVWAKNFGGTGGNARSWKITGDSAGNLYTSGYFNNSSMTTPAVTLVGSLDGYVLKLDSSGNPVWGRGVGGAGASVTPGGLAADSSGNIYAGFAFNANLTTPAVTKIGTQDSLLLKIDSSGSTTWTRNFGGAAATITTTGIALAGNTIHLFGALSSANLTTPAITRIGTVDAINIQVDSAGTTTGTRNYGGAGAAFETAPNGTINSANNLLMVGAFSTGNLTTPALTRVATRDIMVLCEDCAASAAVTTPATTIPVLQPLVIDGVGTVPALVNMSAGNGPSYMDSLVRLLSNTLGTTLQFASQNAQGTVTLTGYKGGNLAFMPMDFRTGDSRSDGIYTMNNGEYQAVIGGQSLVLAPALLRLDQLAALLPGAIVTLQNNGVIVASYGGQTYAVQPGIAVQVGSGGAALRMGSDGYYRFVDTAGNEQVLYPAFTEPATLRKILQDIAPGSSLSMQLDGTGLMVSNGRSYTVLPDMILGTIPVDRNLQDWWQESSQRYRYRRVLVPWGTSSSQGLTISP